MGRNSEKSGGVDSAGASHKAKRSGRWCNGERPELWNRFNSIKTRCRNPRSNNYARYGAKGIKCDWETFAEFEADMLESYLEHVSKYGRKNTQIDRIDSNGNYNKENCRWATLKEQAQNKSNIKLISFNGKSQTLTEWSKEVGVSVPVLWVRIYERNWPLEKALNSKKYVNQFI